MQPFRFATTRYLITAFRAGRVTEQDVFAPGEIEHEPDYRDFFSPRGLGHAAGAGVVLPSGDLGVFDLERSFAAGPFGPEQLRFLDGLRPDLSSAVLMAARLELERARATVAPLDDIGLPAAVIGHGARIFAANPLLEAMNGQVAFGAFDRVRFTHEPAEALFGTAIAALSSGALRAARPSRFRRRRVIRRPSRICCRSAARRGICSAGLVAGKTLEEDRRRLQGRLVHGPQPAQSRHGQDRRQRAGRTRRAARDASRAQSAEIAGSSPAFGDAAL